MSYDLMGLDESGRVPGLTTLAVFGTESDFTENMIFQWAEADSGGALPAESAQAFASWLDNTWNEFQDEDEQTNEDVLWAALTHWTGGRVLRPSQSLKDAYKAAEAAHAGLYADVDDPSVEDNGWRRGPHPIRLADFFAALSGTGTLVFLKD